MDSNLRIVKSISKINDNIKSAEEKQNKLSQRQQELEKTQDSFEKEIKKTINEKEQDFKEQNELLENRINEKINNISLTPGPQGKQGVQGIPGQDGADGKDGKNGKDGKDGLNGKDGKDGKDGINGINGINGKDGISIKTAKVNEDGDLILTFTDGTKINAGHVKGQNGLNGANGMGAPGVSVENVQIIDNHLIVTLSNGDTIDAGYIGGGGLNVTTYGNADFTYLNNCVAYSTTAGNVNEPTATKYGRIVNLSGAFKNVEARSDTAAFDIGKVPTGCEPLKTQYILNQGTTQYKFLLTIRTDGTINVSRYSATATNTAVPANVWLNINATYISAS